MSESYVSVSDAVDALTGVGVHVELAVVMVWSRRIWAEELWVMQRLLLDRWVAELEGAEEDVDGS